MEATTIKDFERFLRIHSERIDTLRLKPMSGKDLTDVLGLTIKRDEAQGQTRQVPQA